MATETLGTALRHVHRLFAEGTATGLSDAHLLDRFLAQRDGTAFEVLIARHGPMVLRVCRRVLHNASDAEDAFQATFLALVNKARSLRGRANVGGWLHVVAYRVAIQANAAAARRRVHERKAGEMAATASARDPVVPDELIPALHEEIARLPEKIRLPVVLCDLQGIPRQQISQSLRLSERTLGRRLAEGRRRLKARLGRRGFEWGAPVRAAVRLRESGAVIPPAWREATMQAALDLVDPTVSAGTSSAAAKSLTDEVLKIMLFQRLAIASVTLLGAGLLGWAASAALISRGDQTPGAAPTPVGQRAAPLPAPRAAADPFDAVGTFPVRGRVLDPDGRPVAGAGVYVRHYAQIRWNQIDPMAARQKGRVALTDADGRFHFELDKGASDVSYYSGETGWHKAQIAVAAPGFAPAWVDAGDMVKRGEVALRLVRDDRPVRGRVLDSQGRPVAGVGVRIRAIWEVKDGVDLDAMLASGAVDENQVARRYGAMLGPAAPTWQADPAPLWPGGRNAWNTGADGRFEVRGIGRDRIARLEFHGGGVADGTLDVMARPAHAPPRARPLASMRREMGLKDREAAFLGFYPQGTQLVGATFEYIAGPTKPIVGVIRLKGSGKPVEGAIVRGADPGTHSPVTARTDGAGRFRLDGVPKGEYYQISLNPRPGIDPFLRHWEIIDDTAGTEPIVAVIEVSPGVIVTGRLVDQATGQTLPPADVEYTTARDNVATGDALGFSRLADARFGLTVPPGRGMIAGAAAVVGKHDPYVSARFQASDRTNGTDDKHYTFRLVGFHTYRFIDVPAGAGPVTADLELTHGKSRAGRLTGPDGLPVVGAGAYGLSAREWSGTWHSQALDANTFEIGGLEPGHPRLLVFTHKTRKLVGAAVLTGEDLKATTPLEVKLVPAGTIRGRLLDDDGIPWAGATLRVDMFDPDRPPGFACSFGETVTADAQGRFQVEAFVPGVQTEVYIGLPNRGGGLLDGGGALRNPVLKPGEVRDLGNVRATPMARE
jgi:RNA polymerase sigma factor (sigma-70 family)